MLTFTPLLGISKTVLSFLPGGIVPDGGVDPENPQKFVMNITWSDVPHLSEEWKERTIKSYSTHERAARTKGSPALGAGAIYPYPEEDILVKPFEIPAWWPRVYALDPGWQRTAALWAAIDRETSVVYLYSEYYAAEQKPFMHARAIKVRGDYIPGVIDPASAGTGTDSGNIMFDLYEAEGLHIEKAKNPVEPGIWIVQQMIQSGRLKVFNTCQNFLAEFRLYRRAENGKVAPKQADHLMDCLRYLVLSGLEIAEAMPDPDANADTYYQDNTGKNPVTGY